MGLAHEEGFSGISVGKTVAVKASKNRRVQQRSTSSLQQVQYQSIRNNKVQQISIVIGIWFGTRCSTRRASPKSLRFSTEKTKGVET